MVTKKEGLTYTLIGLLAVIVVLFLTWVFQGNDFFLYKAFAPRYEQVRRETFEQSKAYNQGMVQALERERIEYVSTKNKDAQAAIASTVIHDYADFDESQLPSDLREFLDNLKSKADKGQ